MTDRRDLARRWAITTALLLEARELLPHSSLADDTARHVLEADEFLKHNELALAMDELAEAGLDRAVPAFWSKLAQAARSMSLEPAARRFDERASLTGGITTRCS
jgi:hypothetical protein